MIVKLTPKNQREMFEDDQRRIANGKRIHYSIGTHLYVLMKRVEELEAQLSAQAIEARRAETQSGSVHESAVHAPKTPQEETGRD